MLKSVLYFIHLMKGVLFMDSYYVPRDGYYTDDGYYVSDDEYFDE